MDFIYTLLLVGITYKDALRKHYHVKKEKQSSFTNTKKFRSDKANGGIFAVFTKLPLLRCVPPQGFRSPQEYESPFPRCPQP